MDVCMPADITIEPFSQRYAVQIFELILPIQIKEFGIRITRQDQPDLTKISEFYQEGNGNFWVAVAHQNVVVGSIGLKDIGNRQLALRKMFVHKSHRGSDNGGIAQRLLETAIHWARDHKITDIFLGTTAEFFAAHRFYEKNEFTKIEKEDLPPSFPVMAVDTKFYQYRFG
jgi:N-acetylglutamate synthase-like GNAT family acetyltransferase